MIPYIAHDVNAFWAVLRNLCLYFFENCNWMYSCKNKAKTPLFCPKTIVFDAICRKKQGNSNKIGY